MFKLDGFPELDIIPLKFQIRGIHEEDPKGVYTRFS